MLGEVAERPVSEIPGPCPGGRGEFQEHLCQVSASVVAPDPDGLLLGLVLLGRIFKASSPSCALQFLALASPYALRVY